jgi:excisionase family DNA binding protein
MLGRMVHGVEEQEWISPQQAAVRLGFSHEHVLRLIDAGKIEAERMAEASNWQIPLSAVLAFEERVAEADRSAAEFSRSLDELGAPLE